MIYATNLNLRKEALAVFISNGADFRARKIIRGKEKHYIIITGLIFYEDLTIFKVFAPNKRMSK